MRVVSTIAEMTALTREVKRPMGLVPTMGALHEGHITLVKRARSESATVVTTIFVNPTQFAPTEDLAKYPRPRERDLALLEAAGVDIVFMPANDDIYPPNYSTWVTVEGLTDRLEGAIRPGHFKGVATVVTKLFTITRADRAYFGQKDGQQCLVIKRLNQDLDLGVDITIVPTVRERDGLAMSSRNVYLTPEQRRAAPVVYRALSKVREMWQHGERDAERLRKAGLAILEDEPQIKSVDYFSIAEAATLKEMDTVDQPAMVSTAVRVGTTRLIDNVLLGVE